MECFNQYDGFLNSKFWCKVISNSSLLICVVYSEKSKHYLRYMPNKTFIHDIYNNIWKALDLFIWYLSSFLERYSQINNTSWNFNVPFYNVKLMQYVGCTKVFNQCWFKVFSREYQSKQIFYYQPLQEVTLVSTKVQWWKKHT